MAKSGKPRRRMHYQSRAILAVAANLPKREIAIMFKGEEGETKYDLAVSVPVGAVAALVIGLQNECAEIDRSAQDKIAAVQPLMLSGAQAADPILGHCALLLQLDRFRVPTVLSKETARQMIAALEEALELQERPPATKLS